MTTAAWFQWALLSALASGLTTGFPSPLRNRARVREKIDRRFVIHSPRGCGANIIEPRRIETQCDRYAMHQNVMPQLLM